MENYIKRIRQDGAEEWVLENADEVLAAAAAEATTATPAPEIPAEVLQEFFRTEYQRRRAAEYPPITDYIDGVVKGDQAQIDAYIDACLAVKAKYPKPEA